MPKIPVVFNSRPEYAYVFIISICVITVRFGRGLGFAIQGPTHRHYNI